MPHVTPLHADDARRVGRYRLTGRIEGMPAAGPVYLARTVDGSQVTITLVPGDAAADAAARDRFTAEASAARRVAPFCAARILGAGFDGDRAFLVSEYVAGPSLREFADTEGAWEGDGLTALAIGTATGLAAVHQAGLVHGEFGPEHVVLGADGPRVIEFGITPPYGAATPAADMRAWAFTMLYAAAGGPAGPADLELLPEPLRKLAAVCLSAGPADRPTARAIVVELLGEPDPQAGVLAEGLRRAAGAAVRPPPPPAGSDAQPGPSHGDGAIPRRPTTIWWAVGIVVCIVAIVVAVRAAQNDSGQPSAAAKPGATSRPESTATDTPRPQASPSPAGTVPPGLAGTWSGQVRQNNPSDVFSVQVTLVPGTPGGTVRYSGASFSCSGALSLAARVGSTLKLNQGITRGRRDCADGVVTLSPGPPGAVQFSFRGKAGPAATGTLNK